MRSAAQPEVTARELLTPEKSFYMNFKLLNLEEAFPKIMRAKLRASAKGGPSDDLSVTLVGHGARVVASKPSFQKVFANKIADALCANIPKGMEEKGIQLKLDKVHCGEMGFVVLRAEVLDVDLMKLLAAAAGTEMTEKLQGFVGVARRLGDVDRAILPRLQLKLMSGMEAMIPAMMKEKARMELLMITRTSAEQADFFFDALQPHHFEAEFKVLNKAEAVKALVKERAEKQFGRAKWLGQVAGNVAKSVVMHMPDKIFGRVVARRLAARVPRYMAEAGVVLSVTETFLGADNSGATVLRCEARDVDLATLRATGVKLPTLAHNQHFLRLGSKGRQEVYQAVRAYLSTQIKERFASERNVKFEVVVRDVQKDPVEMLDLAGLSDDEGELKGADGIEGNDLTWEPTPSG